MTLFRTVRKIKLGAMTIALGLTAGTANAKTSVNAMCYLSPNSSKVVGSNTDKEFELASTSKVVTSFWALSVLGPQYRYKTRVHIKKASNDAYDVHLEGSRDPFFNKEMVYFLGSELQKLGIKKIETLSYDENLEIFWRVREKGMAAARSFDPTNEAVTAILNDAFVANGFNPSAYQTVSKQAKELSVTMVPKAEVRARKISFLKKSDFYSNKVAESKTFFIQSAPLYRILKEMNIYSNNYVAEMIFRRLGGNTAFEKFAATALKADSSDISFINGSGDSEYSDMDTQHPASANGRWYNKATCNTMIQILLNMRKTLQKSGLDIDDVMAVSASDARSTLGGRYAGLPNTVVAKTGSVDPAIGLTGLIATEQGDVLFAVLMKTEGKADWGPARNYIRTEVGKIINKHGGAAKVKYTPVDFLPFDSKSGLQAELTPVKI